MSADSVWAVPESAEGWGPPVYQGEAGELPAVTELLSTVFDDLKNNFGAHFLTGMGFIGFIFVAVLGVLGFAAPGFILALTSTDETMVLTGAGLALVGYLAALFVLGFVVAPLVQASMLRSIAAHQRGEEPLGIGAPFRHLGEDMGRVIVANLLVQAVVLTGILFLYLPGILAAMALLFVMPFVALHGMAPVEAFQRAVGHARDNLAWHFSFAALGFVMTMIVQYIPILGMFLAYPFIMSYQVYAFRAVFGEGDLIED